MIENLLFSSHHYHDCKIRKNRFRQYISLIDGAEWRSESRKIVKKVYIFWLKTTSWSNISCSLLLTFTLVPLLPGLASSVTTKGECRAAEEGDYQEERRRWRQEGVSCDRDWSGNNNFYFNTVKLVVSSGTLSYDCQKRQILINIFMFFLQNTYFYHYAHHSKAGEGGTKFSQLARLGRVETVAAWLWSVSGATSAVRGASSLTSWGPSLSQQFWVKVGMSLRVFTET